MKFIPALILATVAMTAPALATPFCIEQTLDGGQTTVSKLVGYAGGSDGWDGQTVSCTLLSGKPSIAPSRDADGICGPGQSLAGQVPGPVYADVLVDLPDIEQFANLDAKATAKAIAKELLLALIQHRPPQPVAPIYKPFSNGSCN